MTGTYGITIAANVATITLSVPALWWVAVTMLAGLFLTFSTVREWVAGVFDRVRQEEKQAVRAGTGWISPTVGVTRMKIWE